MGMRPFISGERPVGRGSSPCDDPGVLGRWATRQPPTTSPTSTMLAWIDTHLASIVWLATTSIVVLVVTTVLVAVVLVRLPADFLARDVVPLRQQFTQASTARKFLLVGRNVLGWIVIAGGLAMIVLPGPGFLVILVGVMLADFPGKRRLQRWIISRGGILKTANRLRRRFGRAPLRLEEDATTDATDRRRPRAHSPRLAHSFSTAARTGTPP